jgi:CubicO group peptidase (beta-lactamase class C family)
MNTKKLLLGSLVAGAAVAVARRLLATTAAEEAVPDAASSFEEIDAFIRQEMRRLKIPGLALAIVEGDRIVYRRGYGRARPGGEAPTPQTPFVLGSTGKSFTALAVMQLVEAGKIELDAPVQRYLPWFRVADPQASAQMTVRHLLNQTSGLGMLAGMPVLADMDDSPGAAERQARAFCTLKLTRPVGAAFQYCNLNYNLLGLIVEAASGESYADYIQRHIFAPLEMRHSYTSQAAAKQDGLAVGHRYWFAYPIAIRDLPLARGSLASGQNISATEDMAHYLIAQLNGGRYGDAQILSSAGIDELHRGVAEQEVMGTSVGKYGMGWWDEKVGPTRVFSHGGNVPHFSSYMALLPEQKKGVVLLVNSDHWGLPFVLPETGEGVAALLAGQQPPPIRLGFIPWAMRALLLVPLLQLAGVRATLGMLRRWRREPARPPGGGRMWRRHILLPLLPNLLVASGLVPMLGRMRGYLKLYMPDLSWILTVCGSFALVWSFLRTGLVIGTLQGSRPQSNVERLGSD